MCYRPQVPTRNLVSKVSDWEVLKSINPGRSVLNNVPLTPELKFYYAMLCSVLGYAMLI